MALVFAFPSNAQTLRKANKEYELHAYNAAIRSYRQFIQRNPNNVEAMGKLADCYRKINQMSEAEQWYTQAINTGNQTRARDLDPIHFLNYGKVLMALGKYEEARRVFLRYAREFPEIGNHFAENAEFARQQLGTNSGYRVSKETINGVFSDFGPAFYSGNKVVYSSSKLDNTTGKAQNQLFIAERGVNGFLQNPTPLENRLRNRFLIGPVSFSEDGRFVAYTKNNFVNGTRHIASAGMEMSIYVAEVRNGRWVNEVPFPYNGSDYSTGFPSLSPDGSQLYFSSNRPDGFGGYDIFVSRRTGNTWSTPENLGATVNSLGNEVSPYYDGRNLFFASDWHQGMGGYDIFRADSENRNWVRIFNLGNGVNSPRDDYGFIFDYRTNNGYFTSNRPQGRGQEDIYKASKTSAGIVIRVKDAVTLRPIPNAQVDFSSCGEGVYTTDASGVYNLQSSRVSNCEVIVRKSNYTSGYLRLNSTGATDGREYEILLRGTGSTATTTNPGSSSGNQTGTGTGTFSSSDYIGRIIDSGSRLPVVGARIAATNSATGQVLEVYSDNSGQYGLALQPNSFYIVRYSKSGFLDLNRSVRTSNGADRSILGTIPLQSSTTTSTGTYPGSGNTTYPTTGTTTYPGTTTTTGTTTTGTTTTSNPNVPTITGYAVQVAAVRRLDMNSYTNLSPIGNVYYQNLGNVYKIRVGVFATRAEAKAALSDVKRSGYSDAFVVEESVANIGGTSVTTSNNTTSGSTTTTSSGDFSGGGFMVRLGAYRNPQNFDRNSVSQMGYIEQRRSGPYTIMLLSGFRTLSEARSAQSRVQSAGYSDAFVVIDNGGRLERVR